MEAEAFATALTEPADEPVVVPPGVEREIKLAVLADSFAEPLSHLPTSLHDLIRVRDIGAGWHDAVAMMWAPAALVHGARLARGEHEAILAALGSDIVWNGEPITGMTPADAAALAAVHAGRV